MKDTYCKHRTEIIKMDTINIVAQSPSININDGTIGGDDDHGGYDPENSLSREENSNNNIWNSVW